MLTIIEGKDPIFDIDNYDVILIPTTIRNKIMGGFHKKITLKYPIVKEAQFSTNHNDRRKFGKRLTIENLNNGKHIVSLLFICNWPSSKNLVFINYDAFEKCMKTANQEFRGKKVCAVFIGTSQFDGNGDRDKCLKIIKDNSTNLDLYIYDYKQKKYREERNEVVKYFNKLKQKFKGNQSEVVKIENMKQEVLMKSYLTFRSKKKDRILTY